jgi:hydroxyacylglutathione hydrolase
LKADGGVSIWGPESEASKIPGLDQPVTGGDVLLCGSTEVQVINVGGHTLGHIAFYVPSQKILFSGDALFVLGCGRMFKGTAEQFWDRLKRLKELPRETKVY